MNIKRLIGYSVFALAAACSSDDSGIPGDGENASFGGANAKSDGNYSVCELREVLSMLNSATADEAYIREILRPYATASVASRNVVTHRNGPDGILGTRDDNLFDDLDEVDDVRYVGTASLDKFIEHIKPKCEIDLMSRPYITKDTFASSTGGGWQRDGVEFEATFRVAGVSGSELRSVLTSTNARGRTVFQKLRKNDVAEALTYGFSPDEVPWNGTSKDIREELPYVALTVEWDRFVPDEDDGGPRELSLGTDINDDTYFDTKDYSLLDQALVLRGRIRWDNETTVRRLLIGAKDGSQVDENGIKQAAKVDVRVDRPAASFIESIEHDVMRGMVGWQGNDAPINAVEVVYNKLFDEGALPDIGGEENVLVLDPKANLRSLRSRYHFNEAGRNHLTTFYSTGENAIQEQVTLAKEMIAGGSLATSEVNTLQALIDAAENIKGRVAELATPIVGRQLNAADIPHPTEFSVGSVADDQFLKVVAEQYTEVFDELADLSDDADRILSGATNRDFDDYADYFVDWVRTYATQSLAVKTTMPAYLDHFDSLDTSKIADFNTWGMDEDDDFVPVDAANWHLVRAALELEHRKIQKRQIQAAGVLANSFWFDAIRQYYVPRSRRSTGNFMIDTFDMTDMVSNSEWTKIPADDRQAGDEIPADKVFYTTLVNEVQIELMSEQPYLTRIAELEEAKANGQDVDDMLAGAQFVLDTYRGSLTKIAELKGEAILEELEDEGVNGAEWVPATHSKGQTALMILADQDGMIQ